MGGWAARGRRGAQPSGLRFVGTWPSFRVNVTVGSTYKALACGSPVVTASLCPVPRRDCRLRPARIRGPMCSHVRQTCARGRRTPQLSRVSKPRAACHSLPHARRVSLWAVGLWRVWPRCGKNTDWTDGHPREA